MHAMKSQIAQITDEIEEYKVSNKALQEEISHAKNVESKLKQQVDMMSKEAALSQIKFLSDPSKFVEAAKYLDVNSLAWIYSQLDFMVHGMPTQSLPLPYQTPMYPPAAYYGYPVMPMFSGKGYGGETEDLSLIHICRCRRYAVCRSRWSPYH
eukprot:TRINITY_DN8823_c0_g1_i2.p1 TRINITY_DN8823_c0_g1~~TRINITY_DN8823_c0_g1_i2.p1  ORF type:complete len:153 (-),score=34.02 TRINITY_DN8823_c0_g1_i2:21-479(-)